MLPEILRLNGMDCRLTVRRTARKNLIVRIPQQDTVLLSVPPRLSEAVIDQWLQAHQPALARLQARAAPASTELPRIVWYLGQTYTVVTEAGLPAAVFDGQRFRLPQGEHHQQKQQAVATLYHHAQAVLLPRLHELAADTHLPPDNTRLTRAQSFWGVCRGRKIALNWRLIGAPAEVRDYVCLHELCHLREAHHGRAFWTLLDSYCTTVEFARNWLKTHRTQLFGWG